MKVMKWIKYVLIGLVAICLLAVGGIYAASELRLAKSYEAPLVAFDAKAFKIAPAEAERRAVSMAEVEAFQTGENNNRNPRALPGLLVIRHQYLARLIAN